MRYFEVGIIVNTQGIKGEVRVIPTNDDVSRFEMFKTVYVLRNEVLTAYTVERSRLHKQFVILKFKEVTDMNEAEKLKGCSVKIAESDVVPLDEDEYFYGDLYGIEVFAEDGERIGELKEILSTGANDVYIIDDQKSKGGRLLIPATKEFIVQVDIKGRKMTVRIADGLRDVK